MANRKSVVDHLQRTDSGRGGQLARWAATGLALAFGGHLAHPSFATAQCPPRWSSQFALDGFDGPVYAIQSFDPDGSGPLGCSLVLTGAYTTRGSVVSRLNLLASGQPLWLSLGDTSSFGSAIESTLFDPDGPGPRHERIVIATSARDITGVAVFVLDDSAQSWTRLGPAVTFDSVVAIASFDPDGPGPQLPRVVAAGTTSDGTNSQRGLFQQTGDGWQFVGDDINDSQTRALRQFDADGDGPDFPRLLVAGTFFRGSATISLRSWDGSAWTNLLSNADGVSAVQALAIEAPADAGGAPTLLIGGSFTRVGALTTRNMARRIGGFGPSGAWQPVGDGPPNSVSHIALGDPDGTGPRGRLIVAGSTSPASVLPSNLYAFESGSWGALGTGAGGFIQDLAFADPDGEGPRNDELVVVGEFPSVDGVAATNLATWDGHHWNSLGSHADLGVYRNPSVLKVLRPAGASEPVLLAGGGFTSIGGVPTRGFARFDGRQWRAEPGLAASSVGDIVEFDPDGSGPLSSTLAACGFVTPTNPPQATTGVAVQNGDGTWTRLGSGPGVSGNELISLAVFDEDGDGPNPPRLFAAGNFFVIRNGVQFRSIGRWNGAAWEPVGGGGSGGIAGSINAMRVFDEDGPGPLAPALYVAGSFASALNGSTSVSTGSVAKWTGTAWEATVATIANRPNSSVSELAIHDPDGPGPRLPALFATGQFTFDYVFQGSTRRYTGFARLEDGAWRPARPGAFTTPLQSLPNAMASVDLDGDGPEPASLLVCGSFNFFPSSGGSLTTSQGIARYDGIADDWRQLPFNTPTNGGVLEAIAEFASPGAGTSILVSGRFSTVDGVNAHRIARYGPGPDIGITQPPTPARQCILPHGSVEFACRALGSGTLTFAWLRNGQPLADGPTVSGAIIAGSATPALTISGVRLSDAGTYTCVVSNTCGEVISSPGVLEVFCPADFDPDGVVNADDLAAYIDCYFALVPCAAADLDRSGSTDADDLAEYINAFFGPGC